MTIGTALMGRMKMIGAAMMSPSLADVSITGLNGRPISSTSAAFNWTKRVAGTVLSVRYLVQYKLVHCCLHIQSTFLP